jgi:hypothetical protein
MSPWAGGCWSGVDTQQSRQWCGWLLKRSASSYVSWVKLYQSRYFEDEFPEDNERFRNVTYTEVVPHDRQKSLLMMRERMFTERTFGHAVFIGGMGGIIDEFELFRKLQPSAKVLPVISPEGPF